ncbi:MAG: hypothetical protein WCW27_04435 [Patescibacteria group bacterium]|jgi:hypothetical protein
MKPTKTETELFTNPALDRETVFVELYQCYVHNTYAYCALALRNNNTRVIEQLTQQIFTRAWYYFHQYKPATTNSYRIYLFQLAEQVLEYYTVLPTHQPMHQPAHVSIPMDHWLIIRSFQVKDQRICALRFGLKLEVFEIATILQQDITAVQQVLYKCSQQLSEDQLKVIYTRWYKTASTQLRQPARLLKRVMKKSTHTPTFVKPAWWRWLNTPLAFGLGSTIILVGLLLLGWQYQPLLWAQITNLQHTKQITDAASNTNTNQSNESLVVTINKNNNVSTLSALPVVAYNPRSLTQPKNIIYGTNYVHDEKNNPENNDNEWRPAITINLPATAQDTVVEAYVYKVPEALTEQQLVLATLRFFSSLPLNQFSYVNGTYYITDSTTEFRPLFVAFNNDGSVEYQMRQAAICTLPNLTAQITNTAAFTAAYNFLAAHHFIEAPEEQIKTIRFSEDSRTIEKNAFCKNSDMMPVQDRSLVVYPPHATLHYNATANALLPLRLRGIAVQLHGDTVTNMRIDKLQLLQEHVIKADTVTLIPLDKALITAQQFYYSAANQAVEQQRLARSFIQWQYSRGDKRLRSLTINTVKLEYVYDELNHIIEPYYVFSGEAETLAGKYQTEVRLYVVASEKNIELRSPYRE